MMNSVWHRIVPRRLALGTTQTNPVAAKQAQWLHALKSKCDNMKLVVPIPAVLEDCVLGKVDHGETVILYMDAVSFVEWAEVLCGRIAPLGIAVPSRPTLKSAKLKSGSYACML